jgi:hypothetical protein
MLQEILKMWFEEMPVNPLRLKWSAAEQIGKRNSTGKSLNPLPAEALFQGNNNAAPRDPFSIDFSRDHPFTLSA